MEGASLMLQLPSPLTAPSRRFFELWHRLRGDRLLPRLNDFDPTATNGLAHHLMLLEVHSADDIRFGFTGAVIETLLGRRLIGSNYLDLTPPENRRRRAALLLAELAQPCAAVIYYLLEFNGAVMPVEIVSAPLLPARGDMPTHVLAAASQLTHVDASRPAAQSYAEGEGLRFIDIGAGIPPLDAQSFVAQQLQ